MKMIVVKTSHQILLQKIFPQKIKKKINQKKMVLMKVLILIKKDINKINKNEHKKYFTNPKKFTEDENIESNLAKNDNDNNNTIVKVNNTNEKVKNNSNSNMNLSTKDKKKVNFLLKLEK